MKIADYKYTKINKLSKGNQQKVQILCALIHEPSILILDEPLSGLDVINVEILKKLINDLKSQGKYILLSSHQFEHIEEFCDDIIILKKGDVQYEGSVMDLINSSQYHYLNVDKEVGLNYIDDEHVVEFKVKGKLIQLKIDDRSQRDKLFKRIIANENVNNISIEQASIEIIVKERELI